MPPVMRPETMSSIQSLTRTAPPGPACSPAQPAPPVRLLPCGLGDDELRRRAIGRPHDLEVAADPLAHGAGKLDLRALEADGTDDRRVLAGGDEFTDCFAIHADLLDGRLEDLQARPAMRAGPGVGLLLEALHVGVEERLCAGPRLHAPRSDAAHTVGVRAHDLLVERERRADRGEEHLRVEADLLRLLGGETRGGRVWE